MMSDNENSPAGDRRITNDYAYMFSDGLDFGLIERAPELPESIAIGDYGEDTLLEVLTESGGFSITPIARSEYGTKPVLCEIASFMDKLDDNNGALRGLIYVTNQDKTNKFGVIKFGESCLIAKAETKSLKGQDRSAIELERRCGKIYKLSGHSVERQVLDYKDQKTHQTGKVVAVFKYTLNRDASGRFAGLTDGARVL